MGTVTTALFWIALDLIAPPTVAERRIGTEEIPAASREACRACARYRARRRWARQRGPDDRYDPLSDVVRQEAAHRRRRHRVERRPIFRQELTGPSRDAAIVVARSFGLPLVQIARALGLSPQRVSQIARLARRRLTHWSLPARVAHRRRDMEANAP